MDSVLHSEAHLDVGDDAKSRVDFIRDGIDPETYDRHLRAWFFFSQAFNLPIDVERFQETNPRGSFGKRQLKYYCPKSTADRIAMRQTLSYFKIEEGVDPIPRLYNLDFIFLPSKILFAPEFMKKKSGTTYILFRTAGYIYWF